MPRSPFDSGTTKTASSEVLKAAREEVREVTAARLATAIRIGSRLGIAV
jgi:hypothetical protein